MSHDQKDHFSMRSHHILKYVAVVAASLAVSLSLYSGRHPTAQRIREIVREENRRLMESNRRYVQESTEKVLHVLVSFREMPEQTRAEVYKDALEQARAKGYLFAIRDDFLTSHAYIDAPRRLLTDVERARISAIVEMSTEQDQISLMHSILSNDDLVRDLTFDIRLGPQVVHLTPYEKIGIIGGYVAELKHELLLN